MDRETERRVDDAKRLLSEDLLNEILASFEKSEVDRIVNAKTDDERREAADYIRVIRNFKSRLETIALQALQSTRPRANA